MDAGTQKDEEPTCFGLDSPDKVTQQVLSALGAFKIAIDKEYDSLNLTISAALSGSCDTRCLPEAEEKCRTTSTAEGFLFEQRTSCELGSQQMWPTIITHRAPYFQVSSTDQIGFDIFRPSFNLPSAPSRLSVFLLSKRTLVQNVMFRRLFDSIGCVICMSDVVLSPLLISGQTEFSSGWVTACWLACVFWMLEIILNFFSVYCKSDMIVTDFADTSRHYLKGWFTFDFCLVVIDVVSLSMSRRLLRLTRLFKLFRIAGLLRHVPHMSVLIISKRLRLSFRMCLFVLGFLLVSHLLGCLFYYLGHGVGGREGWIDINRHPSSDGSLRDWQMAELYVISLQWAFAHLCLGTTDILEVSIWERTFSVFVLTLGLASNCTVISFFSALIVQHMWPEMKKDAMLEELRIFMTQHSADERLRLKVMTNAGMVVGRKTGYQESEIEALQMISSNLRKELFIAIRWPYVVSNDIFKLWERLDSSCLWTLCEEGITFAFFSIDEEVFDAGDEASDAFVLVDGQANYVQRPKPSNRSFLERFPRTALPVKIMSRNVPTGSWISEAALWSHWIHVGKLVVKRNAKFLKVSAVAISKVTKAHPIIGRITKLYSQNYHIRIVTSMPPLGVYPDDLHVPQTGVNELLSSQFSMGFLQDAILSGKLTLTDDQLKNLEEELQAEKCSFRENKARRCYERYVSLAILRLHVEEFGADAVLFEVGSYDCGNASVRAKCVLPATKRSAGELPIDALRRLVENTMGPFKQHVKLVDLEHIVEVMDSPAYGIETTYDKSVHIAELRVPFDELLLVPARPLRTVSGPVDLTFTLPRVFVLPGGGKKRVLGAWMTDVDAESLKHSKVNVQEWLSGLDIKAAIEITDCPYF